MVSKIRETVEDLESRNLDSFRLSLKERAELVNHLICLVSIYMEEAFCSRHHYLCHLIRSYLSFKNKRVFDKICTLEDSIARTFNIFEEEVAHDDTDSVTLMWFCLPEILEYYPESGLADRGGWFESDTDRLRTLVEVKERLESINRELGEDRSVILIK